jgi:hypothetical protein
MKLGIMQPYFFPYIGYFQLMNAVDEFVVYDNIEYTKKGWINRNRILVNGTDAYISLPLKKDSDYLAVAERSLAESWSADRKKLLNRISESYRKAPHFKAVYPIIESCVLVDESNLFGFILHSLRLINDYLGVTTNLVVSSTIPGHGDLKGAAKVVEICRRRNAKEYINPIGGKELYNKEMFGEQGIELYFLRSDNIIYNQYEKAGFVPWLSIIDVMMFNSKEEITQMLHSYNLE